MPFLHLYHHGRDSQSDNFCVVRASDSVRLAVFPPDADLQLSSTSLGRRATNGKDDVVITAAAEPGYYPRHAAADWVTVLDYLQDHPRLAFLTVTNDPGPKAIYYLFEFRDEKANEKGEGGSEA